MNELVNHIFTVFIRGMCQSKDTNIYAFNLKENLSSFCPLLILGNL